MIWLFAASFGASALGGVLGMASGIFIVPILTLAFGVPLHAAVAASIVSVIACSCASAAPFLKEKLTNVRLAIVLESATTLGALTGVMLVGWIPDGWLYALFAVILLLSARQMLSRRREMAVIAEPQPRAWATRLKLHSDDYTVGRLPLGLAMMYAAGMISALLGIGSGVLKIPAMDTALRLPIKVSSATSNFMIGVTAAASGGAYFVRGDIDSALAAPVAFGSVLGSLAGARLLMGLPAAKLRLFFVAVLLVLAAQMAFCAVRA